MIEISAGFMLACRRFRLILIKRRGVNAMKMIPFFLCLTLLIGFSFSQAIAQIKCVDASGEAMVMAGDRAQARLEAVARAKWSAVEQIAGTEVKAASFVRNFQLVEDVVKTKTGGLVKRYKIIDERLTDDLMEVRINACVEPAGAREAVSELALNNSIALFIPARKPGRSGDEYEETNILSETLLGNLIEQGYTVVDVAGTKAADAADIERAVRSGSTLTVRSMMTRFLSNLMIIGKVDYTISTGKGESIGYGLTMPFNAVTVRLTYRLIARNQQTGKIEILFAGAEQAKGLANSVEDAAALAMKDLADLLTPSLLDKVGLYIEGKTRKVTVTIHGVTDIASVLEIKSILQSIVWVSSVEEKDMGTFIVSYPENTLYLANSIEQKGLFRMTRFSPYGLTLDFLAPPERDGDIRKE